jgi:hypothetical protein
MPIDSPERSLVVLVIAMGATLLGSMSGGSSSLLTTPAWMALGYPLPVAVAADKLSGAVWTLAGARNYLRGHPIDRRLALGLGGAGALGAYAGARTLVAIEPVSAGMTRAAGIVIVALILLVAARSWFGSAKFGSEALGAATVGAATVGAAPHGAAADGAAGSGAVARPPRLGRRTAIAAGLPLGFYEGVLGSGNSIFTSLLLVEGRGLDLFGALGHYYLVAAVWCALSAAVYGLGGLVDLSLALPAGVGAVAGGYLGSWIGRRQGIGVVQLLFVGAGLVLGFRLLLGW